MTGFARLSRLALLAGAAAVLSGCAVGPNYVAPNPPAPAGGQFVSPQATAPEASSSDQPPPNWWRLYSTPDLDPLVQQALTHNDNLLAAAANLARARAALSLARAGQFPSTEISAGGQYGVSSDALLIDSLKGQKGAPKPAWLYSAGLDASYEVDLFGRVRRAVEAAKADYQAQQAAEDAVRISVAGETTRAYVNACAYAQELAVAKQSVDIADQTAEVTAREAQDGGASDLDVARAREQASEVRATLPGFEGQRRAALFELAVLTGDPPEQISAAADACAAPPKLTAVLPVGDIQGLFRRRPDVRQAERQLAADVARIGVATADLYPTISIGASVATSAANTPTGLGSINNLSYAIGPLLSWSFPNTLVAMAQIREAKASASADYANFQGTVLQALQDTEEALNTYGEELQRNAALATALGQAQTAFTLAQRQYDGGRISYLDLLTAQSDLIRARAAMADSDQLIASDQVTVFKALGGGWEQAPAVTPLSITDGKTGLAIKVR